MNGPPFPRTAPGSNVIGEFQIGVSPIGTIPPFDPWQTIISQYANSPIITQLILDFNACIDQTQNLDIFFDLVMNLDTAQGQGLDVWGRILGVSRVLQVPAGSSFGFEEASGPGIDTFGVAAFFNGKPSTQNFPLTDQVYRLLLRAKAAHNITDGSMKAINRILTSLFPNRGNAYVAEGYPPQGQFFGFNEAVDCQPFGQAPFHSLQAEPPMALTYVFNFLLAPFELAMVQQSGVIPKPTGVQAFVLQAV